MHVPGLPSLHGARAHITAPRLGIDSGNRLRVAHVREQGPPVREVHRSEQFDYADIFGSVPVPRKTLLDTHDGYQ